MGGAKAIPIMSRTGDGFREKLNPSYELKRLLDAGLSRYEPDPIAALTQVEQQPPFRSTSAMRGGFRLRGLQSLP